MNPVPIILGTPTKPEDMQERLWLSTKGVSGIKNPNVFEPRPLGKTLEGHAPSKMSNHGFSYSIPNGIKVFSPLRKRRLQMLPLIKHVHYRKVGRKSSIPHIGLIIGKWSDRIPLPIMPPRTNSLNPHLMN